MPDIIFKEESFKIIGLCMEVHDQPGTRFKEIIYEDVLEIECDNDNIPFKREKQFKIEYKGIILRGRYPADFILYNKIIWELKPHLLSLIILLLK